MKRISTSEDWGRGSWGEGLCGMHTQVETHKHVHTGIHVECVLITYYHVVYIITLHNTYICTCV